MNTRPESQGDYEQEAKQIPPGHKLLNGKLVRSLDSNSPIKKGENWNEISVGLLQRSRFMQVLNEN